MKKVKRWLIVVLVLMSSFLWSMASGQQPEFEDRTLSPYFFINSDNPDTDRLPLKSTIAEAAGSDLHFSGIHSCRSLWNENDHRQKGD